MSREICEKLERVRTLMKKETVDGIFLTTRQNVTWVTGGRTVYVDINSESATTHILIMAEKAYAVCNSSERYRFLDEENVDDTFELITYDWFENEKEALMPYVGNGKILCDTNHYGFEESGGKIQKLRYILTEDEMSRMKEIGKESAMILENTMRTIKPGETEFEVAARITGRLMEKGYLVPVCLVGSDERIFKYRHPVPTFKKIDNSAMIAICAQKYGLTSSISRIVSFVPLPREMKDKYEALLQIDATYILNTLPGTSSIDILKKAYAKYKEFGYEKDFHLHHQGGALGYLTRDYCANFQTTEVVFDHQAFSWNPTIAGVKLEDTLVVEGNQQTIVTYTGGWVYREVDLDGNIIFRPDILVTV